MGTLSNNSKVGDKGKDLILQTSGKVYVQVKDRFYEINFRGDDEEDKDEEKELRRKIVEKALKALTTEVDGQTIFE